MDRPRLQVHPLVSVIWFCLSSSCVWRDQCAARVCRAKSAQHRSGDKHKHLLLDKNASYSLLNAENSSNNNSSSGGGNAGGDGGDAKQASATADAAPYKRAATGNVAGVIKGAELEDLTITILTEDDQRLKIKIPPRGHGASVRAKDWFKVIKMLTQDTAATK